MQNKQKRRRNRTRNKTKTTTVTRRIKTRNQTQTQTPLTMVPKGTRTIRDQEEPTATEKGTQTDMEVEEEMTMIPQITRMKKEIIQMMRTTDTTEMTVKMRIMIATKG